jgi:hypothetical protein
MTCNAPLASQKFLLHCQALRLQLLCNVSCCALGKVSLPKLFHCIQEESDAKLRQAQDRVAMVASALQEAQSSCGAERKQRHAECSKQLRQVNDLAANAIDEHEQCKAFMRCVDEEGAKLEALRMDGWRIARRIITASSERRSLGKE